MKRDHLSLSPCRGWLLFLFLLVGCCMSSANAQAQDGTGFQVQQFRQWGDTEGLFQTLSAKTLGQWNFKFGAFFNYSKDPLVLRTLIPGASVRSDNVLKHQVGMEIIAGLGFLSWLDFELAVPVTLYQVGTIPTTNVVDPGLQGRRLDGGAMGDLRVAFKFQGLTEKQHKFGLGAQLFLGLPTGTKDRFNGEESVSFGFALLAHKTFAERVRIAFNLGYRFLPTTKFVNLEIAHELTYGLGLNVDVVQNRFALLAEVTGAAGLVGDASVYTSPLELLTGARVYPLGKKNLAINVGFGLGLLQGYGTPQFRVFVGVTWTRTRKIDRPVDIKIFVNKAPKTVPSPYPKLVIDNVPVAVGDIYFVSVPIQFNFDKTSYLYKEGTQFSPSRVRLTLDQIAKEITALLKHADSGISVFCVAGHAGVKGTKSRKQYLSNARAKKIRNELIQRGIPANKLVWKGYSSDNTITPGRREHYRDRRVEVFSLPLGTRTCPTFRGRQTYIKYIKDNERHFQRGTSAKPGSIIRFQ